MLDVTANYTLADIFQEGSTCWETMLDNLKIYVDSNQGNSIKKPKFVEQYEWKGCN